MSPTPAEPVRLIRQLHAAAGNFLDLLAQEAELLRQWPQPELWPLHQDKLCQLRELELCQTRLDQLARQGLDARPGLSAREAVASQLDAQTRTLWDDTLTLLAACQQRNAGNGAVLERQQQATRQSLELLRGGLDHGTTYGRQGARQHAARHLSLGRA